MLYLDLRVQRQGCRSDHLLKSIHFNKGTKVSILAGALIGRRGSLKPTAAAQRSSQRWRVAWPGHISDSMLTN